YLYSDVPQSVGASDGEPQIVASSVQPGLGGTETFQVTPAATGRYYVVVKFVSGSRGTFQVASTADADFAVAVSPGDQVLEALGETVSYKVSVTGLRGFASPVNLAATGLPAGVTAAFNPQSINPGQSSTLTLMTTASTPSGSQGFTIQGTSGSTTKSV